MVGVLLEKLVLQNQLTEEVVQDGRTVVLEEMKLEEIKNFLTCILRCHIVVSDLCVYLSFNIFLLRLITSRYYWCSCI